MMARLRAGSACFLSLLVLGGLAVSCKPPAPSEAPRRLEISFPDSAAITRSSEQLRTDPSGVSIVLSDPPGYEGKTLRFTAVPMRALLPPRYAGSDMSIVFQCMDGFAATLPAATVLGASPGEAQALLAVEDPAAPWPRLPQHPEATAGPFYLIWKADGSRRPAPEEWPYQISRIAVKKPQDEFRGLDPSPGVGRDSPIAAGFHVFVRNCSGCHTLNGRGEGHVGPDLNVPMNPTEYFKSGVLEKYLRDPRSVLEWKGQRMPSFPAGVMTDAELADLRAYLEYMATRKGPGA
jgi:mono/diheme cytochrome c family protein